METLSVITICFNNLEDLKATCLSVEAQKLLPDEHLIIDGSTNDSIRNWLEQSDQPSYRKWISEKDRGISDAFNKGIQKATGTILHLLNSGDTYADELVLENVLNVFQTDPKINWLSGKILMKRGGLWVHVGVPFDSNQLYKGMRSVSHPTYFLRAGVYQRIGVFKESLKIAMDYDLLCRLNKEPYAFINKTLIRFDDRGVSSTNYVASLKENIKVFESYFGFSFRCRLWQFRLKIIHYVLNTSFGKFLFKLKLSVGKS